MTRSAVSETLEVTAENVETTGFFCCVSKKKSGGYQGKLR